MDPEDLAAPMLIFDGVEPDAPLAGFMYLAYGTQGEPAGFAGPNDHWHYHDHVCIVYRPRRDRHALRRRPRGRDRGDVQQRRAGCGSRPHPYMVHVWNVPGYESPDGMFTELNPRITCPDGTYDRIAIEDTGSKNSVCLNP